MKTTVATLEDVKSTLESFGKGLSKTSSSLSGNIVPIDLKGLGWEAHLEFTADGKISVADFRTQH